MGSGGIENRVDFVIVRRIMSARFTHKEDNALLLYVLRHSEDLKDEVFESATEDEKLTGRTGKSLKKRRVY
ncbi:Protein CBG08185 [Caenorhabditis briggsae]|uniref:Protein CBG08185 n=1 Tax=Caenorhabditis briggsae TaxID=6238 RepID=A8X608_CAEBR|nr:Protein CBG08185 [Caenorhabditis briggsae]CAP28069.2 Protein CBG08185 [Caenorhabditis briggsae]